MSQFLLRDLSRIEERIRRTPKVSLFLDFDGTLVPLTHIPAEARLDTAAREALARFAVNHFFVTTIISGRSIGDLLPRIGLDGIIYAGNHGLEIRGRQLHFIEPTAAARQDRLREISDEIEGKLRGVEGVIMDRKGLTTTVHYRNAPIRELAKIEGAIRAAVSGSNDLFLIRTGKMAFEILPRTGWNKGAAAKWINRSLGCERSLSIYLGDDETDEDAFRALPEGITVKVGNHGVTASRYYVEDTQGVYEFLNWLENHVSARTAAD